MPLVYPLTPPSYLLTGRFSKLTSQPFGRGLFYRLKMSHISPPSYQGEEASTLEIHSLKPGVWCTEVQRVRPAGEAQQERTGLKLIPFPALITWASGF